MDTGSVPSIPDSFCSPLSRRRVLKLLGGTAAGATFLAAPSSTTASVHEQVDWANMDAGLVTYSDTVYPGEFTYTGGRYVGDEATRRQSLVMNTDPLQGLDGQWNAGGSSSLARSAPDSPLGYDRAIYVQLDNFTSQDATATYLTGALSAMEPYNPLIITLPESGMPANAFGGRVSYPFPNDPNITVDRVILGGRRRSDGILVTLDGYNNPFTDDEAIDFFAGVSQLVRDNYNTEDPILAGVPFYGNPSEVNWSWYWYNQAIYNHFGDTAEDLANRTAFHEGTDYAWSGQYLCPSDQLDAEFGVLASGWGCADANRAADYYNDLPNRLIVSDQGNNVTRYFPPEPLVLDDGSEVRVDQFNWDIEGQTYRGIELAQLAGNRILANAFINRQPFTNGVLDPSDPDWTVVPASSGTDADLEFWRNVLGRGYYRRGIDLVDISDPSNPRPLSFGYNESLP